ncbi:MAG: GNAT family N-acetyltransferase [Bdellovibrionota bacterium]
MVKKLDGILRQEQELIHGPFMAEPVRDGDAVSGSIDTGTGWKPVRIWRYSPFGVDILNPDTVNLAQGQKLSIMVRLADYEEIYDGLTVSRLFEDGNRKLAGVRTFLPKNSPQTAEDRRAHKRWTCPESYLPTGTAPNPVRYNDHIIFRVENISAGGLLLLTSLRNKLVGRGQRLVATLTLPLVGIVRTTLQIKHIDTKAIGDKEYLVLGTQFIHPDELLRACLAEYLLNFAEGITVRSLRDDSFPVKRFARWLDFTYVKTESEYNEVLHLRYNAYKNANKLAPNKQVIDMADEFDSRARILVVKHQGRVVGSVRTMFHAETDQTDHGRYIAYPSNFPKLTETIEASRMCTDPEFQKTGIVFELLAHMVLTTIKSGRRYLYSGASGSLLEFYKKCGWRLTGLTYNNDALGGIQHELMLMDTYEVALGKGIGFRFWNRLYANLIDHMIEQELILPTPYERLRLNLFKTLGSAWRDE